MKINKHLKVVLYLMVILLGAIYIFNIKNNFQHILKLDPIEIFFLFLFVISYFLILAYQFKILMVIFKIRLSFKEWFGLSIINTMYSYLLPARGGLWIRSLYLKKKYKFKLGSYIPMIVIANILMLISASIIGIISIIFSESKFIQYDQQIILLFCLIIFLSISPLVIVVAINHVKTKNQLLVKISNKLSTFQNGLNLFYSNKQSAFFSVLTSFAIVITSGLRFYYCLKITGADNATIIGAMVVQSVAALSFVLSITPANLGIKEIIVGSSYQYLDVSFHTAMVAAIIDRIATIIFVFSIGFIYNHFFYKEYSRLSLEDEGI